MSRADPEAEPSAPPAQPGNLLAIRISDGHRHPLFPATVGWDLGAISNRAPAALWGDSSCVEPPVVDRFQPHGIAVGEHASGAAMMAVVNHGSREAVELFEIGMDEEPEIEWRGCVVMPEGMMANDLALFANGGFVVTKFMPPIESIGLSAVWNLLKIMWGWDTGAVYRWHPGGEVELVEGSEGSAPNGIAISKDESEIFVAQWGAQNIYRVPLTAEARLAAKDADVGVAALGHHPDNLTWTRDGQLMTAGQGGSIASILGCGEITEGGCGVDYGVYLVDPVTFEVNPLFRGKGAASVALDSEDDIFVGVFSGDRIKRVRKPR